MTHSRQAMRWLISVFILLGLFISPSGAFYATQNTQTVLSEFDPLYKPGTVLVRFGDQTGRQAIDTMLYSIKAVQTGTVYGSDAVILKVAEGRELELSSFLSAQPGVLYAEPDYLYSITYKPDDQYFDEQWAYTKLHSEQAWDITPGSTSINIAIIDTGIDAAHPDLAAKILPGHSYLTDLQGQQHEDDNPKDLHGHGTHVAGIAAAVTDNITGVAGMSWGARVIPVRVLDSTGQGWTSDIAAGINWARAHGADVINLSVGGESQSATMRTAIEDAHNAGVLVVAAMGNEDFDTPFYPAAYDYVLAVAATTITNGRAPYSNFGAHTDIAAPGGYSSNGILSTLPTYPVHLTQEGANPNYDSLQGTSQAAPFISGLAALIWSLDATLSPDEVANIITSTAMDLGDPGWDQYFGHGLADAKAALDMINVPDTAPIMHAISNADQDGDYVVRWNTVERATNYRLEVSANSGFGGATLVYSGPDHEQQILGQPTGTWYYRVRASNISGNGPWSYVVQTGVLPDPPVLMPISSGIEQDAYSVSWSAVTGAQGYLLQQAAGVIFTQSVTRYLGSDLQYDITGQPGGVWSYRVQAFNAVGSGAWSNARSITVPTTTLESPNLMLIDNVDGDADFVVQWSAVPSTTQYTLEESGSEYFHTPMELFTGALTAYTATNHAKGSWYYRVRGHNTETSSPWSAAQKAVVISRAFVPSILRQYTAPLPPSWLWNGDFEAGGSGWVQYSLKGYPLIVDRTYVGMQEPHGGDWAVWMGGVLGEVAYIEQEVQIYESAPYLTYWNWIESLEPNCGADTMRVIVNASIVETFNLCQDQNTGGWVQNSVDLRAYTGGKATLVLRVVTNYSINSNYFIDDIAFQSSPVGTTSTTSMVVDSAPWASAKPLSQMQTNPGDWKR